MRDVARKCFGTAIWKGCAPTSLGSSECPSSDLVHRSPPFLSSSKGCPARTRATFSSATSAGPLLLAKLKCAARTTAPAMQQLSMRRGFCVRPWPATHPFAPAFRRVRRAGGQQPVSSSQFAPRRPLCGLARRQRAQQPCCGARRVSTRLSPCSTFSLPFLEASTPPLDLLGLVTAEVEDMRVAEITVRSGLRP